MRCSLFANVCGEVCMASYEYTHQLRTEEILQTYLIICVKRCDWPNDHRLSGRNLSDNICSIYLGLEIWQSIFVIINVITTIDN